MTRKKKNGECIYCGEINTITRDHVPPKQFFPQPRPSNLITVPSCARCNEGAQIDEDYFRATFMFSDAGITPVGKKLWDQKLDKKYKNDLGLRRKIAQDLEEVNLVTPRGLYIKRQSAIFPDSARLENVVCKIVKGLYYHEFNEIIPSSVSIMAYFLQTQEERNEAFELDLQSGSRSWPEVFKYRFKRDSINNECSTWLISFYECIIFLAMGHNENEFEETIS
jgi:hypothetical protein